MAHKKSLFAELIERRIPQILGMYVAAVWLAVEIADWMSERFDVPGQFSSYVFVIMIAFLPLVALLGWGHGRPGKDKWTQKQIIFIPFNAAIAWFAVTSFIKPEVQATELMSLVDEQTGQMVQYEVAKSGLNQKVAGFFWENETGDESMDWLSYGAMWLVSKDLMRSPIISIQTPYESRSILNEVRNQGFDDAIGEPLSLDLSIASDRDAQWMIKGRILKDAAQVSFEASLYDVVTGALVTTITSSYDDWLFALDDVAEQLGAIILKQANIKPSLIPDLAISEHVSDDLNAITLIIDSLNAVTFDNDFKAGVAHLKEALSSDESLAEAYVLLISYYRGLGDFAAAKEASEAALKLDHKLYQEDLFKVKANYYAVSGEQDKTIKVLENWVKLHPESADALQALGSNYIMVGNRLDDALAVFEKLNELQETSDSALINQARIYRLKGDQEKALAALNIYENNNLDKTKPHLEKAATYLQFGDVDAAEAQFEEASLLSINSIDADLGLAKIMAMRGDIDKSLVALTDLVERAETDQDKVKILTEKETILYLAGRLHDAMDVLQQMREVSKSYMPPLAQALMFGGKEVAYLATLQQFDEAWALLEEMQSNTKPPFDRMLIFMAKSVHDLQGNDEKSAETLREFEVFLQEFQMKIYDQFVLSAKAIEKRKAGEFEAAIDLHDQAINESRQSFLTLNSLHIIDELMYQKAMTLFEAAEYDEALEILDDTLRRNPLFGQSHLLKAKVLHATGELEAAQQAIEKSKSIWHLADAEFKDLLELKEFEVSIQPNS